MRQFALRLGAAACAATMLAACANANGGNSTLPPQRGAGDGAAREKTTLTLRVAIPRRRRGVRTASYVSPATKSIAIAVTPSGGSTAHYNANLTPASNPHCTSAPLVCTLTIPVKPGKNAMAFATYDGLLDGNGNPTGNELSANQAVAATIVKGKKNVVGVSLGGIPASVAFVPGAGSALSGSTSAGYSISKCFSTPQSVGVLGVDADSNYILGPGAPAVSLSTGDALHLAVATPQPSSPNIFALTRPAIPKPATSVLLTARATPASATGAAAVAAVIAVTFNADVCGTFTEYPTPTSGSSPEGIGVGPDGALWVTEYWVNKIARITTDGVASEPLPYAAAGSHPEYVAAGSDGNVWFTEFGGNRIGQQFIGGGLNEVSVTTPNSQPDHIASGPDGNLWFTESSGNNIARVTTSFSFAEFPVPTTGSYPVGIAAGADGNLWFTEGTGNKIGRITTAGTVTAEFSIPTAASVPNDITAGPDGALWFTESAGKIGRIALNGSITEFSVQTANSVPYDIAAGPDGALWFTENCGNKIGRITTGGTITEFDIPTAASGPRGIVAGPDGAIWFVENYGNKIGRLQ
jgi:virginiamycin B lyase